LPAVYRAACCRGHDGPSSAVKMEVIPMHLNRGMACSLVISLCAIVLSSCSLAPSRQQFAMASVTGDVPEIQEQLDRKININAVLDNAGNTAMHMAALHGQLQVLQLLRQAGANPNILNKRGKTAFDIALSAKDPAMGEGTRK